MVLLAVISGWTEYLLGRFFQFMSWKKVELFTFIAMIVICATLMGQWEGDETLSLRHIIWAAGTALIFISIIARALEDPTKVNFGILKSPVFLAFGGWILCAILASIWAVNKWEALYGCLLMVVWYVFMFVSAITLQNRKDLFIKCMTLLGLGLALYGVIDGGPVIKGGETGTMNNKNLWSGAQVFLLIFCVYSFKYKWFRYIGGAGALLLLYNIITLMTRSAWLALIVASIVALSFRPKLLVIPLILIITITNTLGLMKHKPKIASLIDRMTCPVSFTERTMIWMPTIHMAIENPQGVGPENWRVSIPNYHKDKTGYIAKVAFHKVYYQRAHNIFLKVLSETGFAGFICFAMISVISIYHACKSRDILAAALITAFLSYGMFSFPEERTFHPMIFCIGLALTVKVGQFYKGLSRRWVYATSVIILFVLGLAVVDFTARYDMERYMQKVNAYRKYKDWRQVLNSTRYTPFATLDFWAIPIHFYRGEANIEMENWDQAYEDCRKALKYNPNHPWVWVNLASCYSRNGLAEIEYTKYCLDRALQLSPGLEMAQKNLTKINYYAKLKEQEQRKNPYSWLF